MKSTRRHALQCVTKFVWSLFLFLSLSGFASEQVESVGALTIPRKNHTATVLVDGRVLVVGGENDLGQLASVEVFDPVAKTFTVVGALSEARVGHAATLLPNGTVLITGGRNASGLLSSAEVFDPAASIPFRTLAASMGAARSRHTSTLMANGKVLIAGGDLGGTAEIFDPATESFSTSLIAMIEARAGQTATILPENSILLAGGGTRSVELFDVETSAFLSWPAVMNESRTGQSAINMPDSMVFFVGGENFGTLERFDLLGSGSATSLPLGAPSSTASQLANGKVLVLGPVLSALFNPVNSSLLPVEGSGLLKRSGQTVTELSADKHILVVGGVDANTTYVAPAAIYSPARIETDKEDYYPDEPVIVYGSGWKPGENVDLYVVDDEGWLYDSTVTADGDGLFTADPYFVVLMQHLGVTFDLTAVGAQSGLQAKHTFTDGNKVNLTVGTQSGTVITGVGGVASYTISGIRDSANNATSSTLTFSIVGLPGGIVTANFGASFSVNPLSFPGGSPDATRTSLLTINVPSALAAGSYPFEVSGTGGGMPGNGILTVKAKPTITWNNPASITYGTALSGTQLNASANVAGTFTYTPASGTVLDAGTNQTLHVDFVPTDTVNYANESKEVLLTVLPKTLTVTANDRTKIYGDAVTFAGTEFTKGAMVGGDTLTSVTLTSPGAAVTASVAGSPYEIVPSAAVGTGLSNYSIVYANGTLSVTAKTAGVTANPKSKTYGDANPALDATVTGTVNGDVLNYSLATTATPLSGVGSYPITVSLGANPNYNITPMNSTLTVDARVAGVTANPKSKTYGDANPALDATVTGTVNGDVLNYSLATTATPLSGVGSYPITVSLGANPNYNITPTNSALTVDARVASVTANPKSKTYGDSNPALDATVTGTVNGDVLNYSLATTATPLSGVGSYPITVSLGANPNYNITPTNSALTVDARVASVVANPKSKTYGDANPALDATVTGTVNGDMLNYSLATTATPLSGVGSYPITVSLGANPNYNVTPTDGLLMIDVRAASVTTNPDSKTYGDADPTFTGTLSGFLPSDNVTAIYGRTPGETVGTSYVISATLSPVGVLSNYDITYTTANFTINKKSASVAPNAASKIYGDVDPALSGTLSGFLAADNVTAVYGRTAGESVANTYIINATLAPVGVLTNYDITYGTAQFSITKRTASVTPDAASKIYGDADPLLTGTLVGFVAADNVTANYHRTAGEVVGGSYIVSVTLTPGGVLGNYDITYNTAAFSINKRTASVTPIAASKIYGEADPVLTGVLFGFLPSDNVTATYARTMGEAASSAYVISATLSPVGVLSNYEITAQTAAFTINPRPVTITADAKSKIYGEVDPALTYQITGGSLVSGDSFSGSLTRGSGETVGTYAIGQGTVVLTDNYTLTYVGADLTINTKVLKITANDRTKAFGETVTFAGTEFTAAGLVTGDSVTKVTLTSDGAPASALASGSPFDITADAAMGAGLANYSIEYIKGKLTVTPLTFIGFLDPIGGSVETGNGGSFVSPVRSYKLGSTVPVKFRIMANGAFVVTGVHTLQAVKYSNATTSDPAIDATPTDAATTGNQFRLTDPEWHFNLSTKGNGYSAGTWLLIARLADGTTHTVWIALKK